MLDGWRLDAALAGLDPRPVDGQAVMAKLIQGADVFITGNVGATNEKLGLDYESVRRIK